MLYKFNTYYLLSQQLGNTLVYSSPQNIYMYKSEIDNNGKTFEATVFTEILNAATHGPPTREQYNIQNIGPGQLFLWADNHKL